ncbi:MAG: sulfite exporter TauE/SafE family protein [Lachnospiraceae bacterium]|nr:sulfite exporter TauE/SafE family protein [Lachnospiraceae bacterium]
MKSIILFVICFLSSSVGSVVGAGGGVIIKPVLDITGLLPVAAASFGSGCTVLAMAVSSLIRGRRDGVRLQLKTSTPLALGAVAGGLLGKGLFDAAGTYFEEQSSLGALQSGCLTVVMAAVFFYLKYKDRIRGKQVEQPLAAVAIGVALGVISSFLGIGGGPFNVAVLFFFFAMDAKEAAKNSLYVILFSQTASLLLTLLRGSVPEMEPVWLLCMMAGGVGGALTGAFISKRIDNRGVERILLFVTLLIVCISFMNVLKYSVLI